MPLTGGVNYSRKRLCHSNVKNVVVVGEKNLGKFLVLTFAFRYCGTNILTPRKTRFITVVYCDEGPGERGACGCLSPHHAALLSPGQWRGQIFAILLSDYFLHRELLSSKAPWKSQWL